MARYQDIPRAESKPTRSASSARPRTALNARRKQGVSQKPGQRHKALERFAAGREGFRLPASSLQLRLPAWSLPLGLVIFASLFVPVSVMDDEGLPRYRALRDELRGLEVRNAELAAKVQEAKAQVQSLRDDEAVIEQVAREELGMISPSEVILFVTP